MNPTAPAAAAFVKALRATDGSQGKIFVKNKKMKDISADYTDFSTDSLVAEAAIYLC